MARLGASLVVLGVLCYLLGLLILHVGASPLAGVRAADLMMVCLIGGTFVTVAGLIAWHRYSLQHSRRGLF